MRWLGVLALLVACDIAKTPPGAPTRPRGADNRISPPDPAAGTADTADEPAPRRSVPLQVQPTEEVTAEAPTPAGEAEAEAEAEEPARDLSAELQAALAGAVGCLGVREADQGPDQLSFSVSVTFTESGMATRAEASASGLTEAERVCVRQRALATRLRAPVEGAPRTVAATVTLNRQRSP